MGNRKPKSVKRAESRPYSSRIIKAGALLSDTKTLLACWDSQASVQDNLERLRRENLFGKASRSRVEDILRILRQRYLLEEGVTRALSLLVHRRFPAASLDRILYFHAARNDNLLYDVVTELLAVRNAQGVSDVDTFQVQRELLKWSSNGQTAGAWSEPTACRIAQGLLAALRDFGVLQGAVHKRIAPAYLSIPAFSYVAFYLMQHTGSGGKVLSHPDWRLFFLPHEGVERFLVEAHQQELLSYHAAGTVVRLDFPVNTLEEYANVLAERPH